MSYPQQEQEVFVRKLQRGEIMRSALDAFLRIVYQSVSITFTITFTNLQRLSDLVLIFRQLDLHRSGEGMRRFSVNSYLEDTVHSLKHKFPGLPHQIGITGDDALTLESFPGAFLQIISSLLMNA